MNKVNLWGYTIYEDGTIIGLNGKRMLHNKQVLIQRENTKKAVSYARFVYYAFNRDFDFDNKLIVIRHINGNKFDFSINNLASIEVKMIKQGENSTSAKLTDKEVEEIKALYSQAKEECLPKNSPNKKMSCRKLAEMYGVSPSTINGIVNGRFRNKENYILK